MIDLPKAEESIDHKKARYESELHMLLARISELKQPLVHGTTSEMLDGILKYGLKKMVPGDEIPLGNWGNPNEQFYGTISAMDAGVNVLNSLYGSYFFCRKNTEQLGLTYEQLHDEDYLMGRIVPGVYAGWSGTESEFRESLATHRAMPKHHGWPLVLVFDAEGTAEGEHWNDNVPEEFNLKKPLPVNQIKIILVPESRIEELAKALEYLSVRDVKLFPVECLEV